MNLESLIQIQYCYEGILHVISFGLLLYSHIPTALVAILFAFFLVYKKRNTASISLFIVCLCFALWCFLDLTTWFSFMGARNTMFTWSLVDLTGLIFFFFSYRFLFTFINDYDLPRWQKITGLCLILPTALTTLLGLNLKGFDANLCEATEQSFVTFYPYLVQLIFIFSCICLGISSFRSAAGRTKQAYILFATLGISIFLIFFFTATFVVKLLIEYTTLNQAYNFTIYGLFGMPILLILLGYLIVQYRAFNIKLIGAQAIIATLVFLDGSQAIFSSSQAELVVNIITILLVILFGSFLIRSVKQEIAARERNELLAKELAGANARLRELDRQKSEFVSIASHQLRSPLTSIRGYASMLMEGSYGKMPAKIADVVSRIQESSSYMALSIEDFLNVSRIEQGRMKYECVDTNLIEMTEKIVDELRGPALKKGLVLLFRSKCESKGIANVDPGKMRQIIYNVIDNSLKYTLKGSITVTVQDDVPASKLSIAVTDTGVGMSEETLGRLFDKFVRARNANTVNVSGTGLGLFVARQMIKEMRGTVTASSEGEGKGSTFTIEVPLKD